MLSIYPPGGGGGQVVLDIFLVVCKSPLIRSYSYGRFVAVLSGSHHCTQTHTHTPTAIWRPLSKGTAYPSPLSERLLPSSNIFCHDDARAPIYSYSFIRQLWSRYGRLIESCKLGYEYRLSMSTNFVHPIPNLSTHALPYFKPKWSKSMPYSRPKRLKSRTVWGRAFLYGLYQRVPPPPPAGKGVLILVLVLKSAEVP